MNTITAYGFKWGPIEITRLAELRGRRVVRVSTDHHEVEVYASPRGRSIRVWVDGQEVTP